MSRRETEDPGLSELRERAILDALPAHVSLLDVEGTIVSVNEAWRRFAQDNVLAPAAVGIGENYLAVCDRATGPFSAEAHAVAAGIRGVLSGSLPLFSLEYPCHAPDRPRWFRLTVTPLEQGHGAVNMHVDITHERLADQALAEREEERQRLAAKEKAAAEQIAASEERFRLLARATNDAVWDWNLSDDSLWWNEGLTTLFGFLRQDSGATIASWTTRLHPDDKDAVVASVHAAISSNASIWSSEYRFLRQDGAYAYVLNRGHIIRDDSGKALRMIGGMTDLTDRKRFEERLLEQATLLDKAHDAIMVRNLDHHILYWNQSAERLYGWPAAEAMGHAITDIIHADPVAFAAADSAMHATGEWRGELEKHTKDGRTLIVEGHWTLVLDDQGQPKSVLVIDTDITARKSLEAQFLRAQRMESLGALAGGIAHDLNNALTPIIVTVSALREERDDPGLAEDLALIESCALRGSDMVRQLLSFARGSEGRRHKTDMVVLVEELRKIVRDTFPKNITFHAIAVGQPWQVHADATQIHQLLTNLFVNARDAMPHGGALSVAVQNVVLDEVFAGMHLEAKPGPYVLIRVEDNGEGMPPKVLDRMFEPFFTTKQLGQGTGLGLSTVHAIVRNHDGFIQVASVVGKGTSFTIYLPSAHTMKATDDSATDSSALPRGDGQLVLVVDDEEAIRTVAQRMLERYGYRVVLASNGAEAVSRYAQHRDKIAVVLTDMSMPVMDGPATIVALRSLNPKVRIIGSSGLNENAHAVQAMIAGLSDFVPKPYTADVILRALKAILAEPQV